MGAAYSGEVTVHWVQSRPSDRASDVTVTVTFNQKTSPVLTRTGGKRILQSPKHLTTQATLESSWSTRCWLWLTG